ncbi:non-ribosomal peptide synthetase [Amycolatopsis balhimycina DSM 5908]|uniref:Non-ribosomal peptide synthetase n=1 Tax=Amycolatopsis balhimycina DSM 5908 TaxID=1081091 RepID=A0A428WL54_AMYBA|nr:non-ribosomal peptide synthetase [Amycolatopsis balhimycina]RSM43805.1 non-ribosomal peptide synthetase [Amycolatopsis balhimycina DSM 5908]
MTELLGRLRALTPERRAAFLRALRQDHERYDLHPLTAAQRRMWLHEKLRPGSRRDHVSFRIDLDGDLDVPALTAAFDRVLARHQALRTVFADIDGEPWQLVLAEPAAESRLRVASHPGDRPFDLEHAPPVRATLSLAGWHSWVLHLELHHIVCDGWSMGLIFDDLSRFAAGGSATAQAPRHVDVAFSKPREELLPFWRDHLRDAPSTVELPADRPRPAVLDEDGEEVAFSWPAELAEGVAALAVELGGTPFMVLLAAWEAVLRRYGRERDFVVATPVSGRTELSTEDAVGLFVNTLALRATVDTADTFRELAGRVRDTTLDALTHQDLPFDTLVDDLRPERDPSRMPLAQVMFAVEEAWADRLRLPGVAVRTAERATGTATYDLTLLLTPRPGGIDGRLEYRTSLFDRGTAERIAGHVRTLLTAALAGPDRRVGELPLLSAPERREIDGWSTTKPPVEGPRADELVAGVAAERIAVVAGDSRLTYGELTARANRIAALLRRHGVTAETPVGVCLPPCPDAVAAFLGVLAAGGMYVPLNAQLPADRIRYLVADSGAHVVLADETTAPLLPPGTDAVLLDEVGAVPGPPHRAEIPPDAAAYLIYTSGSTGRPKGVVCTHRGLTNLVGAIRDLLAIGPDDRVLQFHSAGFDAVVSDIVTALCTGAELHLAARHDRTPGPDLVRTLRERRITMLDVPPVALQAMDPAGLPDLRVLTVGGEVCPADVAAAWSRGREFFNTYGPTETSVMVTGGRYPGGPAVPIGAPMTGARIHVVDEDLHPVPAGVTGEICIGGACVGRGYLGRPAQTAAAFVPDPFAGDGTRMYRTGDLAKWRPDGSLDILGRADAQVKIRGHRVEPGEVEARLRDCAGVDRCAVVVREDVPGDKRLVGYVVSGTPLGADELRDELSRELPDYLVPTAFVRIPELPVTPNGKLDHRALPAPGASRPRLGTAFRSPRGAAEEAVATVWRAVLGLDEVGVDDNFFDLGGNSMLLVKVHEGLQAVLGVRVAAVELFRYPTVAQLARFLADGEPGARRPESDGSGRRALATRTRRVRGERGKR